MDLLLGPSRFGLGRANPGLSLGNQALLLLLARDEVGDTGLLGTGSGLGFLQRGFGLLQPSLIVAVVDPSQYGTGFERLIILYLHRRQVTSHTRGNGDDVGPQIGVVSGHQKASVEPPVKAPGQCQQQ